MHKMHPNVYHRPHAFSLLMIGHSSLVSCPRALLVECTRCLEYIWLISCVYMHACNIVSVITCSRECLRAEEKEGGSYGRPCVLLLRPLRRRFLALMNFRLHSCTDTGTNNVWVPRQLFLSKRYGRGCQRAGAEVSSGQVRNSSVLTSLAARISRNLLMARVGEVDSALDMIPLRQIEVRMM